MKAAVRGAAIFSGVVIVGVMACDLVARFVIWRFWNERAKRRSA